MADIRHRIGVEAGPHDVYESLTTLDGLASWWTTEVTGDPTPGGQVEFCFGAPDRCMEMAVVRTEPDTNVTWRCVSGPDEWVGTTISFELIAAPDETVVLFTHAGWREPVEFLHHCSTKWASFLIGMKAGLEGGKATPHPRDVRVSSWH